MDRAPNPEDIYSPIDEPETRTALLKKSDRRFSRILMGVQEDMQTKIAEDKVEFLRHMSGLYRELGKDIGGLGDRVIELTRRFDDHIAEESPRVDMLIDRLGEQAAEGRVRGDMLDEKIEERFRCLDERVGLLEARLQSQEARAGGIEEDLIDLGHRVSQQGKQVKPLELEDQYFADAVGYYNNLRRGGMY